jgi:hypothetical protein
MFSKYLLPNLSMPTKVPRLVSPVHALSLHVVCPIFQHSIPMFYGEKSGVSRVIIAGESWLRSAYLHLVAEVLGGVS